MNQQAGTSIAANTSTPIPYATIIIGAKGITDTTYTGNFTILSSDANNATFAFSVTYTYTGP